MFEKILSSRKALIGIGLAVALLIALIWSLSTYNSLQKGMVQREQTLSAKYLDNQNVLSNYRATIKEAMGVAQTSTAAQNKVLEDAIKGRYDVGSTAKPSDGSAFSAIFEAYPNLDKIAFPYEKVQSAIFSGREAFKNQQTALLDLLREYQTWKNSGFPKSLLIGMVGAPSKNLEACIGTDCVTGEAALKKMKQIVLTEDSKEAFDSGTDEPLDLGPADEPTP